VIVALTGDGAELRDRALAVPGKLMDATGIDPDTLAALRRTCQALTEES